MDGMGLFRQQDKEGPTELYLANSGFQGQEAFLVMSSGIWWV